MERLQVERRIRHLQRELVILAFNRDERSRARHARLLEAMHKERGQLRQLTRMVA